MIDVRSITDLHRLAVHRWHRQPEMDNLHEGFLGLVCAEHQCNSLLWHEEDIARDRQVKMYNDPSLNPRIYGALRKAG